MNYLELNIEEISYSKNVIIKNTELKIVQHGLYAFFGKNGAGKTTFLKTISGLKSFKGNIFFNKKNIDYSKIAWIPSEPYMYEYLKVKEFYSFFLSLNKNRNISEKLFDINDNQIIKDCSTGNKKKVYINTILQINDYDIYIFDEPFNGLDFESTYILLDYIKHLSSFKIVLISSHIIEIIEKFVTKSFYVESNHINEICIKDLKK